MIQLSIISGHGFLDFCIFNRFGILNIFNYLGLAFLFNCFYIIIPSLSIILFLMLSMYHFGQDFVYLSPRQNRLEIWNGVNVVSSTIMCRNSNILISILKDLGVKDYEAENIFFLVYIFFFISYIMSFLHCDIRNFVIITIYLCFNFFIFSNPLFSMIQYLFFVHSPLAVYRISLYQGEIAYIVWTIGSMLSYFILYNYDLYQYSRFVVSILVSHIVSISIWQNRIVYLK